MINPNVVDADQVNSGAKHDFIFQFICAKTGGRSEPFISTWTELAEIIAIREKNENSKPHDEDYILLVAVMDGKQSHIPTAPLLRVDSYLENVNPEKS